MCRHSHRPAYRQAPTSVYLEGTCFVKGDEGDPEIRGDVDTVVANTHPRCARIIKEATKYSQRIRAGS